MRAGLAALILLTAALAGCAQPAVERVDVLASFYPLGFLAERIAGGLVSVATVIPDGVEPHDYEPSATDLVQLAEADLLIVQGATFETWIGEANARNVVVATRDISLAGDDPHTWLDPVLFTQMARTIEDAMATAFPAHAESFRTNTANLTAALDRLDNDYRDGLADCETRFIITNHASFGYLATRYDFEQLGISGLSPEAEPDPQTVSRVVDAAKAHNVSIIFFEDLVSPRVAEIIAREVNAQTRVLSPLESASPGKDYESVARDNLAMLREAMRCA